MKIRPGLLVESEMADNDGIVGREPGGIAGIAALIAEAALMGEESVELEVHGFARVLLEDGTIAVAAAACGVRLVPVS